MATLQKGDLLSQRYLIEELLGQGAMGRVYRAVDQTDQSHVAIKVMSDGAAADPHRRDRFVREAETLKRLAHPDILQYIDHGRQDETDYLVIELLTGHSLGDVKSEFFGDAARVMLLGARLARAFDSAHNSGIIHRDIKPDNIHITETGEPRVLDYGLARWVMPDEGAEAMETIVELTQSGAVMGTLVYMSPEQLRGERVDRRADIFALGVVLYELAGGRRPYEGKTLEDLYRAIDSGTVTALYELSPRLTDETGRGLHAILDRTLRPLATDRFQTMRELAEALEKAADLSSWMPRDASIAILLPPPSTLIERQPATLRGRDEELALLVERVEVLRGGEGAAVMIEGSTGMGKSLLANEAVTLAHQRGCLCLTASTPAIHAERGEHPALSWLRRGAEIFPSNSEVRDALEMFQPGERPPEPHEKTGGRSPSRQQRLIGALTALASRMPLVLLLEDLDRAEPALLGHVQKLAASCSVLGILLIMTRRSDAVPSEQSAPLIDGLQALPGMVRMTIGALDAESVRGMAEDLYSGLNLGDERLRQLVERSEGNPGFVRGILKVLEDRGELDRVGIDWEIGEKTIMPSLPQARSIVDRRLEGLGQEDLHLLEAAAILGLEFEVERLAALLDREPRSVRERLAWLDRNRHLVLPGQGVYRLDQRLTRDVLLQRLAGERKAELHARAAEGLAASLEQDASPRVTGAVAQHFLEAGRPLDALTWAMATGMELRRRNAPVDAVPWLQRALGILEHELGTRDEQPDLQNQLAEIELALGECLLGMARHKEAQEHLEKARGLAVETERKELQAKSLILLSQDYMARGDLLQSERKARDAVRLTRRGPLDTEHALALSAEAHALSRSGEFADAEELWKEAAEILEEQGKGVESAEVYFRLGNQHFRMDQREEAKGYYDRAAGHVDREANPRLYGRIQNALGAIKLAEGDPSAALEGFAKALEVRQSIGATRGAASTRHNMAHCHYNLGEFEAAVREADEVLRIRREIGDRGGYASTQRNRAHALFELGRLEEALTDATEALATKRELEDLGYLPQCLILVGEIELSLGRLKRARDAFNEIQRDFAKKLSLRAGVARLGIARVEWRAGNLEAAEKHFSEYVTLTAENRAERSDHFFTGYWPLRFFADRGAPAERLQEIADALVGHGVSAELPHSRIASTLSRGILHAARGEAHEARTAIREGLDVACRHGFREWVWRIHGDLSRFEPAGSEAWASEIRAAVDCIRLQSRTFSDDALRREFLQHPERVEWLEASKSLPEDDELPTMAGDSPD